MAEDLSLPQRMSFSVHARFESDRVFDEIRDSFAKVKYILIHVVFAFCKFPKHFLFFAFFFRARVPEAYNRFQQQKKKQIFLN